MCNSKLKKIYQQGFAYSADIPSARTMSHTFQRIYKSKPEEYFKIKVIATTSADDIYMVDFAPINAIANFETTLVVGGVRSINSNNYFYLGNQAIVPEVIVADIPLSPFRIVNMAHDALEDYSVVFQIELWE